MLLLVLSIGVISSCFAFEIDLTVDVAAGKMECFYQAVKKTGSIEVEYQVIDGGDLDINFFVQSPDDRVLISEHKKTDNFHKVFIEKPGDMKVCLDNTFSHFASKLVFFELISEEEDDEEDDGNWDGAQEELNSIIDMRLDDFRAVLDRMGQLLDKSRNLQTILKMHEARDRNIVESNFDRVNILSGIQLTIMLLVGFIQVILIRHLFDDKSKVSGLKSQT